MIFVLYNAEGDIAKPKNGRQQLKSLLLILLTNLHHVQSILQTINQQVTLDLISIEEEQSLMKPYRYNTLELHIRQLIEDVTFDPPNGLQIVALFPTYEAQ